MNNLVLLAYGSEKEYQMATNVVLSFFCWYDNHPNDARFVIYTDNPNYFNDHLSGMPVEYRMVTSQKWDDMLQGYSFKFHRKMAIIRETFESYPNQNVVFLDSDVFFYTDPRPMLQDISDNVSYMHIREQTLDKQITFVPADDKNRYIKEVESTAYQIGDSRYHYHKYSYIWNAGVIGMSPAMAPYVSDVSRITEDIWQMSQMHISEQLAHTFVLGAVTRLKPADQHIVHYWKKKDIINTGFAPLFEQQFVDLPMQERLNIVKSITSHYGENFDLICHEEEALLALKNKNFNTGIKATVKAVLQMLAGKGSWDDNTRFLRSLAGAA